MIIVRLILGTCFFFVGIAGIFLPILQAWLFFLLAAVMFFPRNRMVQKIVRKADVRTPRIARFLHKMGIGG